MIVFTCIFLLSILKNCKNVLKKVLRRLIFLNTFHFSVCLSTTAMDRDPMEKCLDGESVEVYKPTPGILKTGELLL